MNHDTAGQPEWEFDTRNLVSQLVRRWYIAVAIILVSVFVSFFYTKLFLKPQYTSVSKIMVFSQDNDGEINTSDLSVSTYLALDYSELIVDRTVLNEVIDDLNLNMSYNALKSMVTVNNPKNTRILEITVTTYEPEKAQKIADSIRKVAQEKIVELMGIERVTVISEAYLPTSPVSPVLSKNLTVGFLAGVFITVLLMVALALFDDKIKREDDIQKYFGITVLATIPYAKGKSRSPYGRSKKNPNSVER